MQQKYTIEVTESYKKALFSDLIKSLPEIEEDDYEYRLPEIKKAYDLAFDAHKEQRRKGGDKEPYISHPVAVAKIVSSEMGLGTTSVVAALLHDVVEDSEHTIEEIVKEFGETVATIVGGVTKITEESGKEQSYQLETFKKMIILAPQDHRVILIKIADRLHNMRTMEDMPDKNRQIKSSENLFIYAPIANVVGMRKIKNEIEDLSFRYLDNEKYLKMKEMAVKYRKKKKLLFENLKKELQSYFMPNHLNLELLTIEKSLFSAWQKIKARNTELLCSVHNFYSIRIVIGSKNNNKKHIRQIAYTLFQEITEHYDLKINSLQDYIKEPKKNGFSALIFNILDKSGNQFEIQILSKENHKIAENGFLPLCRKTPVGLKYIENIVEEAENDEKAIEIIERLKLSINPTKIFVFTPKGKKLELPKNATVLDFAFKIHTELGLHCVGAEINDRIELIAPSQILNPTDKVKIIYDENKKPEKKWLNCVVTSNAKKNISSFFSKKEEQEKIQKAGTSVILDPKKPLTIDGTFDYITLDCCNPLPGEPCIAYQDESMKLYIHKKDCIKTTYTLAAHGKKTTSVIWKPIDNSNTQLTKIEIIGYDKMGIIENTVRVISNELSINMKEFWIKAEKDIFRGEIQLYVFDLIHRDKLIKNLKKIKGIIKVNS